VLSLKVCRASSRRQQRLDQSLRRHADVGQAVRPVRWLLLGCLLFVAGCDGCRISKPVTDKPKDEEEEKKEDFESQELQVLPTDKNMAAYGAKPGHWYSLRHELKANQGDFQGELAAYGATRDRQRFRVGDSPFSLQSRRPVVLPKGQGKAFEQACFVPHQAARSRQVWLYSDLQSNYGGMAQVAQSQLANRMRPYQGFLVVLARRPDAYGYLKTMESIRPPTDEMDVGEVPGDYVTVLNDAAGPTVLLPSWSMMWSSVAYLIWDDFDPQSLTPDQQRSLLDWLHWGGQLIVSGPTSLDALKTSFLGRHLPVDAGATRPMTVADVAELDRHWSIAAVASKIDPRFALETQTPPPLIQLNLRPAAQFVPHTGELLAERRVGRGRIVVTSFSLTAREFTNWRRFDNFFNACILRRPARTFAYSLEGGLVTKWVADIQATLARTAIQRQLSPDLPSTLDPDAVPEIINPETRRRLPSEALVTSGIRYFSRDAHREPVVADATDWSALSHDLVGYRCDSVAGVAGWNDFSDCSDLARRTLTDSAGIAVPDRSLIILALGLYLFVLVPANWVVFRALGRVEWAWAAVPLIAGVGTVAVVRLAQLDIGFARSRTELAIVESQPGLPRAHVTRYSGLYTSLSTNYALMFSDESAIAMPLATAGTAAQRNLINEHSLILERADKRDYALRLSGMAVSSNSTGMVHCEYMLDIGGAIELADREGSVVDVVNRSRFDVRDAGVVRRRRQQVEFAWIGLLKAGSEVRLQFRSVKPQDDVSTLWRDFGEQRTASNVAEFDLRPFLALAADPARLNDADVRMVGWLDQELPGLRIEPEASQNRIRTVWVVNLAYGAPPLPRSDTNAASDFRNEIPDDRTD